MSRVIFGGKHVSETRKEVFNFTSLLAIAETISSATVTATVYSGADTNPSAIINGAATISGAQVTQSLTGGIMGTTYLLTCTVATSAAQTLILNAFLTIVPASI